MSSTGNSLLVSVFTDYLLCVEFAEKTQRYINVVKFIGPLNLAVSCCTTKSAFSGGLQGIYAASLITLICIQDLTVV